MNDLTPEEVRAMRGTPFTYVFSDGDTAPAFIAQVQLGKGLTCKALEQFTRDGYSLWIGEDIENNPNEYDNIICYPTYLPDLNYNIQRILKEIKETGHYRLFADEDNKGELPSCSFN